ncbi:unnamed protein product [Paramecium primaurelia]|uniref:Uncharacterized protein n=1 Tax=Paramecium primaurelia TaxID=5886 RepID=A0A8S1LFQ9_PARPR|nr:unnamed protein product [Paramecium primaurelia]
MNQAKNYQTQQPFNQTIKPHCQILQRCFNNQGKIQFLINKKPIKSMLKMKLIVKQKFTNTIEEQIMLLLKQQILQQKQQHQLQKSNNWLKMLITKKYQLDILNEQETQLTEQRANDADDFIKFEHETENVIEAIEVIFTKLSSIQPDQEVVQILTQLNQIGASNPILALMQVASTFSKDQLNNVLNKLSEVSASLEQSLHDARQSEIQAQLDYERLMVEIESQRESLSSAREDSERQLKDNEQALDLQKKRKEDATDELNAATSGKEQKEGECDGWRTQYASDTEHRQQEISIIRQIEEILATKLKNVKVYLLERSSS